MLFKACLDTLKKYVLFNNNNNNNKLYNNSDSNSGAKKKEILLKIQSSSWYGAKVSFKLSYLLFWLTHMYRIKHHSNPFYIFVIKAVKFFKNSYIMYLFVCVYVCIHNLHTIPFFLLCCCVVREKKEQDMKYEIYISITKYNSIINSFPIHLMTM